MKAVIWQGDRKQELDGVLEAGVVEHGTGERVISLVVRASSILLEEGEPISDDPKGSPADDWKPEYFGQRRPGDDDA